MALAPSHSAAIAAAMGAARRAAAVTHLDLKRGLNSLATIAAVAPLLALLLTVEGILGSFIGISGSASSWLAAFAERLARAMVWCALGLPVGIFSLLCYRYLQTRLEEFVLEMESITLEFANHLSVAVTRRFPATVLSVPSEPEPSL